MPVHCYFGAPGSGKTYELVNRVLVEAVAQGRTVFHNIPGIDADVWADEFGCDPSTLKYVDDDWFLDSANFPATDEEFAAGVGVLRGGELIICDEASTIFPRGTGRNSRVDQRLDSFLRKHRHFTGDVIGLDGTIQRIAVDLYFATQDHQSIHSTILHLCSLRVDFEEMKSVFGKNAYRAIVYKSHRATKANRHKAPMLRKTDAKGFKRYHSFAGGADAETAKTENSASVWSMGRIARFAMIPVFLIVAGLLLWKAIDMMRGRLERRPNQPVQAVPITPAPTVQSKSFDPAASLKGECVQHLIDVDSRTYFDGESWQPVRDVGGRWYLGSCFVSAPRKGISG